MQRDTFTWILWLFWAVLFIQNICKITYLSLKPILGDKIIYRVFFSDKKWLIHTLNMFKFTSFPRSWKHCKFWSSKFFLLCTSLKYFKHKSTKTSPTWKSETKTPHAQLLSYYSLWIWKCRSISVSLWDFPSLTHFKFSGIICNQKS